MQDALELVLDYQRRNGWDALMVIDLLCEYINRQQSNDALEDCLKQEEMEGSGDTG